LFVHVLFAPFAWSAESGRELYFKHCASCHGAGGRGDGPVAADLKVKVTDLTLLQKGNKGLFPLARVMTSIDGSRRVRGHGSPTMPVWGEIFEKEIEPGKYPVLTSLLKTKIIAEYVATLQR
jgi:mono/diheme cytochrome c family protein